MQAKDYFEAAVGLVFIVVGGLGMGWFKILKETNSLLKEQNSELKIANKELLDKHNDSVTQMASMQGQIDVLKSIPLVNIDTTLKQISDFNRQTSEAVKTLAGSNKEILNTLQASATTLIKNTKDAAGAAEEVKQDLKHSQE